MSLLTKECNGQCCKATQGHMYSCTLLVTKPTLLQCCFFQVTWDNDQSVGTWSLIPYVYLACHWLAMSHCCANPLIYCWMNSRFRQGFRQALGRLCCGRCSSLGMGPMGLHGAPGCGGTLSMARGNTMTSYVSVRRHKSQAAIPLVRTAISNGHQQQQQQDNGKLISNGYRDQQF